jgi:GNAT superfamily N-acetyltransferase
MAAVIQPFPDDILLRSAEPADAARVGALGSYVFFDTYAREGLRDDLAREAAAIHNPQATEARIRDAANHFVLAEREGHLLGFSQCALAPAVPIDSLAGGVELARLFVHPRAHRQGIGAALLLRAEGFARGRGAPVLWLAAWSGNANARAFYAAMGYEDIGATPYVFEG